jgi:hypothetical protein
MYERLRGLVRRAEWFAGLGIEQSRIYVRRSSSELKC